MVAIQIRDVPEQVREALTAEARRRGESLQVFVMGVLEREAASARNVGLVDEWQRAPLLAPDARIDAAEIIRQARDERAGRILDAVGTGAPEDD